MLCKVGLFRMSLGFSGVRRWEAPFYPGCAIPQRNIININNLFPDQLELSQRMDDHTLKTSSKRG